MKLISILTIILMPLFSYSQDIAGDYYGKFEKVAFVTFLYDVDSNLTVKHNYGKSKLTLNKNNTFEFSYYKVWVCAAIEDPFRVCTGTFTKNNDTLILNSTYSVKDFCKVEKRHKTNYSLDSILIYLKPTNQIAARGPRLCVTADSKFVDCFSIGDSFKLSKSVSNIHISSRCLYNMDWKVELDSTSLYSSYVLNLKKYVNGERIFFDNIRLKVENNKLIMLDNFYFLDIVNNEFIK